MLSEKLIYIHIFDSTVIRQTNNKNSTASTVSHILVTNKQIKTCIGNFQKRKKKKKGKAFANLHRRTWTLKPTSKKQAYQIGLCI